MRAGVDGHSHRVSRGVCVVKLKAMSLLVGAIIASSFSAPTKYGAGSPADAADGLRSETIGAVTVPEFVPVVNFSEFVLATEQFASENRQTTRDAAEALSARFASASDTQQIEPHQAQPHEAIPIVTSALSIPIPDPREKPTEQLADPVKVVSAMPEELPVAPRPRRELKKKAVSASQPRAQKRLPPAMGLGMPVVSAKNMRRRSSLTHSAKTIYTWNGSGWSASGK